jgi:hypothetical protein
MPFHDRIRGTVRRDRIGEIATPIASRPVIVDSLEQSIRQDVEASVRSQLNLAGDVPAEVKEVIDTATKVAAARSLELTVARATEEATRTVSRGSVLERFDSKIKEAAAGIAHIGQSNEVDQVLKQRAELLAKKKQALVTAGFTDDQAMEIVLADIAARAH